MLDSFATVKTASISLDNINYLFVAPVELPKYSFPIYLRPNFSVMIGLIWGEVLPKSTVTDILCKIAIGFVVIN